MDDSAPQSAYIGKLQANNALQKLGKEHIGVLDKYALRLETQGLPVIYDAEHLSQLLGYEITLLYAISNQQSLFYRSFYIPKRNGDKRLIREPLPSLKEIQRTILSDILNRFAVSKASKAFSAKSSIKKMRAYTSNKALF